METMNNQVKQFNRNNEQYSKQQIETINNNKLCLQQYETLQAIYKKQKTTMEILNHQSHNS